MAIAGGKSPMAIDRTCEFQSIVDVLTCLEVSHQDQSLILDVLESNLETWAHMKVQQRSFALQSALQFFRYSTDLQSRLSAKTYFESCLIGI